MSSMSTLLDDKAQEAAEMRSLAMAEAAEEKRVLVAEEKARRAAQLREEQEERKRLQLEQEQRWGQQLQEQEQRRMQNLEENLREQNLKEEQRKKEMAPQQTGLEEANRKEDEFPLLASDRPSAHPEAHTDDLDSQFSILSPKQKKAKVISACRWCCLATVAFLAALCMFGPTYHSYSADNAIVGAKDYLSSLLKRHRFRGVITVRNPGHIDNAHYFGKAGDDVRDQYISSDGCRIAYDGYSAWVLSCSAIERCHSLSNSIIPQTESWRCINGEAPPVFKLINSVIMTKFVSGEKLVEDPFVVSGTRNGKNLYENENGCQIAYSKPAWDIWCYIDFRARWEILYCAVCSDSEPPMYGWTNRECGASGRDPIPSFTVKDVSNLWDENRIGTTSQTSIV